jgi:nucleoside-diphosphate-sugar epimerase
MTSSHSLPTTDLALPPSSLILVTGATGFIASHIVSQLLTLGYHVRGTVRSSSKAELSRSTTQKSHPNYSNIIIPDVAAPHAFDSAIKGVSGVIHVASDTTLDPNANPRDVIDGVKRATVGVLQAAAGEPSVKRVVLTSSSSAAALPPVNGEKFHIDGALWNQKSLKAALEASEEEKKREPAIYGFNVYAASKTEGERAAWQFMKDQKPGFVLNSVLPNFNMGTVLEGVNPGPTGGAVLKAYNGKRDELLYFPPQWEVNVQDDARVHIGALIDGTVQGERLFAYASSFNWNDLLEAIRKVRPEKEVMGNFEGMGRDETTVDNEPARNLLKKWFGQDDWTSLEDTVRQALKGVE